MMSIVVESDQGLPSLVPMSAHPIKNANTTVYVKALKSMLGTDIFSLGSSEICIRYLLIENTYSRDLSGDSVHPLNGALTLVPKSVNMSSSRSYWCNTLKTECALPSKVTITLIQRQNSRHILNINFVVSSLRKLGWLVNVIYLEELSVSDQFRVVQNSTTIIGYHGAGLSWSQWIHPDAAEIQLIGFPCAYESHSSMKYKRRYSIQHAALDSIGTNMKETLANMFCSLIEKKLNKSLITSSEEAYFASFYGYT
jgi:hypothetical protein